MPVNVYGRVRIAEIDPGRQQPSSADSVLQPGAPALAGHAHSSIRRSALALSDPSLFALRQNADQRRSRLYIGKRNRQISAATFRAPDADDVDGLSDVGDVEATDADVGATGTGNGLSREQWVDRLLARDAELAKKKRGSGRCDGNE